MYIELQVTKNGILLIIAVRGTMGDSPCWSKCRMLPSVTAKNQPCVLPTWFVAVLEWDVGSLYFTSTCTFPFSVSTSCMSKVVDKAVDKAGPIFIAIGVFLIDLCVLAFYGVVFPYSHSWSDASFFGKAWIALVLTFTLYMVYCIHFHYYMAIKTPPGTTSSSNNSSTVDASSSNHQVWHCLLLNTRQSLDLSLIQAMF